MVGSRTLLHALTVGSALLLIGGVHAQPERPQFGNFALEVGSKPRGIVMADFDGDGRLDVVTGDGGCPRVWISFGTTDDYLAPAVSVGGGCDGRDVTTGDFDGNGTLDLASATESGEVAIHLGNGDGTFAWPVNYPVGSFLHAIAAGDFNGDNFDDVVTATLNPPQNLYLMPGNGDGTFGTPTVLFFGQYTSIVAGHLNNDTHLDLVATDHLNDDSLRVFVADGLGGFNPPVDYPAGGGVVLSDLDDDGDSDLATTLPGGQISVLVGNGDGTFLAPVGYPTAGATHDQITSADLDGDGALDLVAAGGGAVSILTGLGDGSFGAVRSYSWPGYAWSIAVADLNEDSKPDVFGGSFESVQVLPGNGDGTVLNRVFELEWNSASFASAACVTEVDLDGRPDVIFVEYSPPGVFPLYGNPDGSFEFGVSVTSLAGLVDATVGEFGVNGTPDLVILADPSSPGPEDKALWILHGLSPRTFVPTEVEGPAVSDDPSTLTAVDLDGNGETDVLVTDEVANEVIVMMGLGSAQFVAPFPRYAVGSAPIDLALGRLDGDLHLDLVVVNRDSDDVAILLGNGDGTFQPASFSSTGAAPASVELGDLNNDGNLDLVVLNVFSFPWDVTVRLGNGDGTFGPDLRLESGTYSERAALGDFDRDGNLDLALGNSGWFKGNGDGTFEPRSRHLAGSRPMFAADLDQDGWIDLVAGTQVLINQGGAGMLAFELDGETLRWPGVLDADSYGIYRGDMSLLVDVDTDGLPDGGYGVCLSGADPDPADTIFSDTDVPTVGGDGFFYIRSVVSAGGEDLGSTSGGLLRVPSASCP